MIVKFKNYLNFWKNDITFRIQKTIDDEVNYDDLKIIKDQYYIKYAKLSREKESKENISLGDDMNCGTIPKIKEFSQTKLVILYNHMLWYSMLLIWKKKYY